MKTTDAEIESIFSDSGLFSQSIPNYISRNEQVAMALEVNRAINQLQNLVVEAGTGVGKTFAYLVPALLADKQVVVSTGTKNLQNQLYKRDLPNVLAVLGISPKTALLKGRNNYLCEYRLESTLASGRLPDPIAVKHLNLVNKWKDKTTTGDLSELSPLPDHSPVLPFVTSNTDNCLGQDCPFIDNCYVASARERARSAKVLVVNHHLLLADLVLKEDGFGELLPDTDIFIIDEAHHLPKTAYQFYGESVTSRQLTELCREIELNYRTELTDARDLMLEAQRLSKAVKDFRLMLPEQDSKQDWEPSTELVLAFDDFNSKITNLYDIVKKHATRTKVMESCFERLIKIKSIFETIGCYQSNSKDRINWYETFRSGFSFNSTPLDVAALFQNSRDRYATSAWIMTSATITVNHSFEHFVSTLGWNKNFLGENQIKTLELDSSFDYQKQSILYVPRNLVAPNDRNHPKQLIDSVMPLLIASKGRAFILYTSHRALKIGAEYLKSFETFNCLVQGESSKDDLIAQFISNENSVLLATGAFWEGVDIRGNDLILVVIDKLPFSSPDDPVLNAKIKNCNLNGGKPFFELQIPDAVLSLKQGIGRLIRSVSDKGVVCIGDTRLVSKDYSKIFVESLPDMRRTRCSEKARNFLEKL